MRNFENRPGDSKQMSGLAMTTESKSADNGHLPRQHRLELKHARPWWNFIKGIVQKNGRVPLKGSDLSRVAKIRGERRVMG